MMCVKLKHISSATNYFAMQGEEGNGREGSEADTQKA